jgi:hypothetical protein
MVNGHDGDRGGLTIHRGILHPDEYVDAVIFQVQIEQRLHCSLDEFERWYGRRARGRPRHSDIEQRTFIRERVDPVLLGVVEDGGHVEWLARVLGVDKGRIYEAAHRARSAPERTLEDDPQHCSVRARHEQLSRADPAAAGQARQHRSARR